MKRPSPWIGLVVAVLVAGVAVWRGWYEAVIEGAQWLLLRDIPIWAMLLAAMIVALCGWAIVLVRRGDPSIPRETLRFVPALHGNRWHMGSFNERPAMQVVGDWRVTNIARLPVHLLHARLVKPATTGSVMVTEPDRRVVSTDPIPPGATTWASVLFWVQPPVRRVGENFTATVVIVDQFGNEHRLKKVVFKGPRPTEPEQAQPPREPIHAVTDPVERDIVAVLKDEVNRYEQYGRRDGGLGSIQTRHRGAASVGVGTEWRRARSPERQSIIPEDENPSVESDNANALLNLYQRLQTDEERARFGNALLARLARHTEYAPVGYLILLVFLRIGRLSDALDAAGRNLRNDGAHGFSDFLRLLDALLRFCHASFTSEQLDDVERFAEGVNDHTFNIEERIAAIRAYRLARTGNG
jgi:hypothetical protein